MISVCFLAGNSKQQHKYVTCKVELATLSLGPDGQPIFNAFTDDEITQLLKDEKVDVPSTAAP